MTVSTKEFIKRYNLAWKRDLALWELADELNMKVERCYSMLHSIRKAERLTGTNLLKGSLPYKRRTKTNGSTKKPGSNA